MTGVQTVLFRSRPALPSSLPFTGRATPDKPERFDDPIGTASGITFANRAAYSSDKNRRRPVVVVVLDL